MADISIIAEGVRFTDGHVPLGVAAGDHAAMLWPMMCGLAKARYYLLTSDFIEAEEAERIGLVSKCVPADQLMDEALARRHAAGRRSADGDPLHQAVTEPLDPQRGADLRELAGARDPELLRPRHRRGPRRAGREARAPVPVRERRRQLVPRQPTVEDLTTCVAKIQRYPYVWPAPPDAESTRRAHAGSCAGKHAVLVEDLAALELVANPMFIVGPLVPPIWDDLQAEAGHLLEVHECVSVETPWSGPLLVDVTWQPAAIARGMPGTLDWDGVSDMRPAVEPVRTYAVSRADLRTQKEVLRNRLYTTEDRRLRDRTLAEIARRATAFG